MTVGCAVRTAKLSLLANPGAHGAPYDPYLKAFHIRGHRVLPCQLRLWRS